MWKPLGRVTVAVAGVPARATVNQSDPAARFPVHSILFQQVAGNTGYIYIKSSNAAGTSNILATLAIPTSNILQSASCTVANQQNGFNVADYWIDVSVGGESCQVSAIEA